MAPIVQFIRPHDVYDPETLAVLDGVYDRALASSADSQGSFARPYPFASSIWLQRASAIRNACARPRSGRFARGFESPAKTWRLWPAGNLCEALRKCAVILHLSLQ